MAVRQPAVTSWLPPMGKMVDLRNRVLFVFLGFAIFIFGLHISVPGIDREALKQIFNRGGLLGLLDVFTGGALRKFSIFAMGITPYINASIIMQLMTVVSPELKELQKEGEFGRRKIAQYTRYLTIAIATVQAAGLTYWLRNLGVLERMGIGAHVQLVIILVAGTAFLLWLGEEMSEKGIGNGVSLLIFAGIIARMPSDVANTYSLYRAGGLGTGNILSFLAIALASIAGIVYIYRSERRVTIQYAKRIIGRKMMGGQSYLPIKVNQAGVIPIIFAVSVVLFPVTIGQFVPALSPFVQVFEQSWAYHLIYAALVVFFTFFYTAVTFDPQEVADNIKKNGGFIPGIRPGRPTAEYLDRILTRITVVGALFLAAVAVLPQIVIGVTNVPIYFGGTSILILVGVALDTLQQLEAHLLMRHYEGFI